MMGEKKNILMKASAIILALFLWFYVGIEQNPPVERYYSVPVTLENVPMGLLATPEQYTVGVSIRDRQDRLNTIQVENIKASIDMSEAKLGRNTYPVVVKAPGFLRVTRTQPKEMTVTVVQESGVQVPLQVNRTGTLDESLTLGEIDLSTTMVFVSGEESQLNRIAYAAVEVDLNNISETYVSSLPVRLYAGDGTAIPINGLTVNPEVVLVTVPVNTHVAEKNVPVKPVTVGSPAEGYTLNEVIISPQTVTLVGDPAVLEEVEVVETEAVDVSGSERDRRQSVELNLPENISVRGSTSVEMTLLFSQEEGQDVRYIVLPVTVTGGNDTKSGEIRGSDQIRVYYKEDLDAETVASQLEATVDIADIQPGIHDLSISISNSNNALTVEHIEPNTVTVVVT